MRTLSTLAILLVGLAIVLFAPAAKADCPHNGDDTHQHCGGGSSPSTSNEFRFVGFADETFNGEPDTINGGQGMIAMHELCQDDFGAEARLCTSKEFWLSPNAEAPLTDDAWLHSFRPSSGVDFTGYQQDQTNCTGWTLAVSGSSGTVVTTDGKPSLVTCDTIARPVTCCAPIQ